MGFPMQEISQATGLSRYGEPGPFMSRDGTLIGFKKDFLIATGLRGDGRVAILARFKSATDSKALITALKADAAMKKMYTIADINLTGPQSLVWTFNKPMRFKVDEFAQALDSMAATMSQFAQGFAMGKCEGCDATISMLTLANGIPNLMCAKCQQNVSAQQAQAKKEYERRQPNAAKAVLYGVGMAIAVGAASALLKYWDISGDNRYSLKLFLLMPIGISAAIAWAVKTGVRRVTVGACVVATVISVIGGGISEALFFALYYAKIENWPMSAGLLFNCLVNLPFLEWDFNGLLAVAGAVSVLASGFICWSLKPKFNITFKEIVMPPEAKSAELTLSASV